MLNSKLCPCIAPASTRRGTTLIEVLVAIMLFAVGALALAASTVLVVRETGIAHANARIASAAASRIEALASTSCAAASSGSAAEGALRERWSVAPSGANTMKLDLRVSIGEGKEHRFESMVGCR